MDEFGKAKDELRDAIYKELEPIMIPIMNWLILLIEKLEKWIR